MIVVMKYILSITSLALFLFVPAVAHAETFFVDSYYDAHSRTRLNATVQYEGVYSRWYVSDGYWSKISPGKRSLLLDNITNLSREFDSVIYPKLRNVFGSENTPGVDGDPKITILLAEMIEDAGGYIREQDAFPREKISISNEREMINLNILHIGSERAKSFLAHEFQHLITLNQKILQRSVAEDTWTNELRSEIAPTLLGYDNVDFYENSNLKSRVEAFLKEPSDAILDWENKTKDYASVNLFGQYILDHYGRSVFAAMTQSDRVGIDALNAALEFFGFKEDFNQVYTNWTIAVLLNDCLLEPVGVYCYKNPALADFHIQFGMPETKGDEITSDNLVKDWRADWNKYEISIKEERPAEHIFRLEFQAPKTSKFNLSYVVYDKNDAVLDIKEADIKNGEGVFFVEDFGFLVPKIVAISSNRSQITGGDSSYVSFSMNASTVSEAELDIEQGLLTMGGNDSELKGEPQSSVVTDLNIQDGSLIRAQGDYKVYIVKDSPSTGSGQAYKRWIQSAEIFDFYGHLNFDAVQTVTKETLAPYKDAWLVRAADDTKVYEINGDGTRHWLDMTPEKFTATGRNWDMVYLVDKNELEWYIRGANVN